VAEPLKITLPPTPRLAAIVARRGVDSSAIAKALGATGPLDGPGVAVTPTMTLVATGPGAWLAIDKEGGDLSIRLGAKLAGLASISDQSGGYRLFRIAGEGARTLLQRGVAIDLDHDAFPPASAALSVIAHIGVIILRMGPDTYDLLVFRSYADSFRDWAEAGVATLVAEKLSQRP
jgi:methylglutamate dehydrogenase subunit D